MELESIPIREVLRYLGAGGKDPGPLLPLAEDCARELLVVVGDDEALARMAANDRQQRRYSGLRWRLARGAAAQQNNKKDCEDIRHE